MANFPMCWKCSNAVMVDDQFCDVFKRCLAHEGITNFTEAVALCPLLTEARLYEDRVSKTEKE